MRIPLSTAIVIGVLTTSSWAGDLNLLERPDKASFNWSGLQVGVQYGYSWMEDTFPDQGEGDFVGAYAAYNHQFGNNLVLGAEIEILHMDNRFDVVPATLHDVIIMGGRVGYAFGTVLPYATVGTTYADTDIFGNDWGVAVGGGVDVMVTENILVGGKYMHHYFSNFNSTGIQADVDTLSLRVGFKF